MSRCEVGKEGRPVAVERDDFIISFPSLFSNLDQSQHHDDEKRALSREIIVLNNHLMEAKLTIEKLQEDNVRMLLPRIK